MKYTVRLKNDIVGTIDSDTLGGQSANDFIGEVVMVKLYDENGNIIEVDGELVEILEESEY
jgi:hypothetical protein